MPSASPSLTSHSLLPHTVHLHLRPIFFLARQTDDFFPKLAGNTGSIGDTKWGFFSCWPPTKGTCGFVGLLYLGLPVSIRHQRRESKELKGPAQSARETSRRPTADA